MESGFNTRVIRGTWKEETTETREMFTLFDFFIPKRSSITIAHGIEHPLILHKSTQ